MRSRTLVLAAAGYSESGGGVNVSHSRRGFAPRPPDAGVLRITAGGATVELDLQP